MLNGVVFIYHFSLHRDLSYPQVCTNYSLNVKLSVISIVSIIRISQTIDISFETFIFSIPTNRLIEVPEPTPFSSHWPECAS